MFQTYIKLQPEDQLNLAWESGTQLTCMSIKSKEYTSNFILMYLNNFYVEIEVRQDKKFQVIFHFLAQASACASICK